MAYDLSIIDRYTLQYRCVGTTIIVDVVDTLANNIVESTTFINAVPGAPIPNEITSFGIGRITALMADISLGGGSSVTSVAGKVGAVTLTSTDVSLGNVDNTSDINKPVSVAVQNALDSKVNKYEKLAPASWRPVADRCDWPSSALGNKSGYSRAVHRNFANNLTSLKFVFANSYQYSEANNASDQTWQAGIEYPIGSGVIQLATWAGSPSGTATAGTRITSDELVLTTPIPRGAFFHAWYFTKNNAGIVINRGGNFLYNQSSDGDRFLGSPTFGDSLALSGVPYATIDAYGQVSPLGINALYHIRPQAILGFSDVKPVVIFGDSRSTPDAGDKFGTDRSGLCGCGPRLVGYAYPYINLSASNEKKSLWNAGGSQKALRTALVTDYLPAGSIVLDALGTNDAGITSVVSTLLGFETSFLALPFVADKEVWGATVPPAVNVTSDRYSTLAGQTPTATAQTGLKVFNNYRRSQLGKAYKKIFDVADLFADPQQSNKWKVAANGRTITVNTTLNSSTVVAATGDFIDSDTGHQIYIVGAGTGSANVMAEMVRVSSNTIRIIDHITKADITAMITTAGVTAYVQCQRYAGMSSLTDVIHESQYASKQITEKLSLPFIQ